MSRNISKTILTGPIFVGLLSLGLYQAMRPRPLRLHTKAKPSTSYEQALARLESLKAQERTEALNPACRTHLLDHGHRSDRAVVLIHGYTNCPYQFHQFAPMLYERGYNVLLTRLPKHGFSDRLAGAYSTFGVNELAQVADEAVDIACGLGRHVTILGFSFGGVIAAWLAQRRSDIDRALLVSPALAIFGVPLRLRPLYADLFALLPNTFRWWDPEEKNSRKGPQHAYPGWSTRGLGALLRLVGDIEYMAPRAKPAVRSITLILNPNDEVVDNRAAEALVKNWRKHGADIHMVYFPAEWRLIHDLMDPDQPDQQIDRVYPRLLDWIEQ